MQLATEAELVQNSALGSSLLWAFTLAYSKQRKELSGPQMPLSLAVLPIAFHRESVEMLHRRNFDGGLDLALAENRTLVIDLQERMQAMLPQTMIALNIALKIVSITVIGYVIHHRIAAGLTALTTVPSGTTTFKLRKLPSLIG
jgi:hypothetical protein